MALDVPNLRCDFKELCPWCKRKPKVQTHDDTRYWAACVNPDCKVMPVTFATETPEEAVKIWDSRKR